MTKITDYAKSPHAKLDAVPMEQVTIADAFWRPKREVNHRISIPHQYAECERTGRIANFRRAASRDSSTEFRGIFFNDSDVYKWMEAAAFDLIEFPDPEAEQRLEDLISLMAQAQCDDGYLNTHYILDKASERWSDLTVRHELYLGGHMIQAAVAHHRVTGRDSFLNIAVKWADHVAGRFGPEKEPGAPGHPEVEMALVELYRTTGNKDYLDVALFFIEQRGRGLLNGSENLQDHLPIRQQRTAVGHAVRQLYLTSGVTDIYAESGDESLMESMNALWKDFIETKHYLTGGAGARYKHEEFGDPYELPNDIAYAETCAAIASFMWNWRMLQVTAEAKYADVMEQALYSGLLGGVSLGGKEYFYTNPLEHDGRKTSGTHGTNRRTTAHWDGCACCPPNVARTLASLPGYLYSTGAEGLYIHHFIQGTAGLTLAGRTIHIEQITDYPWEGAIKLAVHPDEAASFALHIRRPHWATEATVSLNGEPLTVEASPGSYIHIERTWQPGDIVNLEFPMPIVKVRCHPKVAANAGRIAITRGPIVYCIEQADLTSADVFQAAICPQAEFRPQWIPELLGGVVVLRGEGRLISEPATLYTPLREAGPNALASLPLTLIPYFAWANRSPGSMRVWIPTF